MRRSTGFLTLSAAAIMALGACSDTPAGPTQTLPTLNADIANAVADGVGEDVQLMRDLNFGLRTGLLFMGAPAAAPNGPGCTYDAVTGWHVCEAKVLPVGLTILRQYAFYDASGAAMEKFDPAQTAAIRVKRQLDGSVSREVEGGSMTAEVHHARDMAVSGLQGDEQKRTWDGTGQSQIARTRISDASGTRSYEIKAGVTIASVVVPHRNNQDLDPWPLSGTITKHVTGTATVNGETRSIDRTVVIRFDGTQFPTATVNGEPFTLDLAARKALRKGRP
jgi:hypothetical protein